MIHTYSVSNILLLYKSLIRGDFFFTIQAKKFVELLRNSFE